MEQVNPFDAHVPDGSFDPLGVKQTAAVAAGGDAFANGGGDGGWAGAGGAYGGGFGGGGQDDAAAVLQLGMQFEVNGRGWRGFVVLSPSFFVSCSMVFAFPSGSCSLTPSIESARHEAAECWVTDAGALLAPKR